MTDMYTDPSGGVGIETADDEALTAIFRGAHSVKGGAATFGFADMAELTHQMETLLHRLRRHDLEPTALMVAGQAMAVPAAREQVAWLPPTVGFGFHPGAPGAPVGSAQPAEDAFGLPNDAPGAPAAPGSALTASASARSAGYADHATTLPPPADMGLVSESH